MKVGARTRVLDVPVDPLTMGGALSKISDHLRNGDGQLNVLAVNPEKVYALRDNAFLREFFESAGLLIPDGIGVVFAMRLKGIRSERVAGADLMPNICKLAADLGRSVFVYGAHENVDHAACAVLQKRYPGLRIAGRSNGYFSDQEELVRRIRDSGAEVLFVALGSPRQEQWMHGNLHRLPSVKVCQGIGGTLDTIAGTVKRAPTFLQRMHLEWFYRLLKQPTRIGRQVNLFRFFWTVTAEYFLRGESAERQVR